MKRLSIILGVILLFCVSNVLAQETKKERRSWLVGGVQYARLTGEGEAGNTFDKGIGIFGEIGFFFPKSKWAIVLYGLNMFSSKNWVKGESINATIWVPFYMEGRVFFNKESSISPFISFGGGVNSIKFENTKGAEVHGYISAGIGAHILTGKKMLIQVQAKPYIIIGNNLGQSLGFEMHLGLGYSGRIK